VVTSGVACLRGRCQFKEIADRLDGKVPQLIGGDKESGPVQFQRIERVIVRVEHQAEVIELDEAETSSAEHD
jgi:hypothetical protein